MGFQTSVCWTKAYPFESFKREKPMTKHFDMLPERQKKEALELHEKRGNLNEKERQRYLRLAKKALFLYGIRGCT